MHHGSPRTATPRRPSRSAGRGAWLRRWAVGAAIALPAVPVVPVLAVPPGGGAGYRPLDATPAAVRGGVLLLPVALDAAEGGAPPIPRVRFGDGRVESGVLGVVVPSRPDGEARCWTTSAEGISIEAWSPALADRPMLLLVRSPAGVEGPVQLLRRDGGVAETIEPRWLEPAPAREPAPGGTLPDFGPLALPDPHHPLEYFRVVLLADRYGVSPPPPPGDAAGALAALHGAEVWRAALARVARASRGVAAEIRERLTATVSLEDPPGQPREIAAWLADPVALRRLLALMLDPERTDRAVMQGALAWIRARPETVLWPVLALPDRVELEIANPGFEQVVLRCRWIEGDPIPSAAIVPARALRTIRLARPLLGSTAAEVLSIHSPRADRRVDLGVAPLAARPPGLSLGSFRPTLTLADAEAGRMPAAAPQREAFAEVRRRGGRWELFIECFRPEGTRDDRLRIELGPPQRRVAVVEVSEHGPLPSGLAVAHRRSHGDRWRCRIELPQAWLAASLVGLDAPALGLAVERLLVVEAPTGPPLRERSTLGLAAPPWRTDLPTIAVDLSAWPADPDEPPLGEALLLPR